MKRKTIDFTKDHIEKSLIAFALPLLGGYLFQLLYSLVDSMIVGNFVGKTALAGIGASTPVIDMMVGFFMGFATGAGVVISQYIGAEDWENMRKTVHNSVLLSLLLGVGMTVVGVFIAKPILTLIRVPEDTMSEAVRYLTIYFCGLLFMYLYNMGAAILRAIGDAKRPLYYLIFSSLVNVILDLLFVKVLHWGVAGAGIATVIAQAVSAVVMMWQLLTVKENYQIIFRELRPDRRIIGQIFKIGIPSGLQQSLIQISNIVSQSYINSYGSATIAGFSIVDKLEGFTFLPLNVFNMAITTFVGQNVGARKTDRIRRGIRSSILMSFVVVAAIVIIIGLNAEFLLRLFNSDSEVIAMGKLNLMIFLPANLVMPIILILGGALRGMGKSFSTMAITVACYVVIRQIYLFAVRTVTLDVRAVLLAWPTSWILCCVIFIIYFWMFQKRKNVFGEER